MFDRMNPNYINASSYKGIRICERWTSFAFFKEDMYESWKEHEQKHGGRETTLDRINVNGNYEITNIRWATQKEQARNKKDTVRIPYKGKLVSLVDVCEELNLPYSGIRDRLKRGYSVEQALTYKPWEGNRKGHSIKTGEN